MGITKDCLVNCFSVEEASIEAALHVLVLNMLESITKPQKFQNYKGTI